MISKFSIIFIVFCLAVLNLLSNTLEDTIRVYKLGDINVLGKHNQTIQQSSIQTIDYHNIQTSDVKSVSELQLYIPSARISTNSRGESLLYLRGAGERQLGVFFDGVPLNIAWDNRFDLSLLPVNLIGKIEINKNGNTILYGPNVLGGALNINTFERAADGFGANVRLQSGEADMYQAAFSHDGKIGELNYILSANYLKTAGSLLSSKRPDSLLNQDMNSAVRTNSDREFLSAYGRVEYEFTPLDKIGVSILQINGSKGVSPETDISSDDARFWRYPDWNRTLISANAQTNISKSANMLLRASAWYDIFSQQINSYKSTDYAVLNDAQIDDDDAMGTRLSLDWHLAPSSRLTYVLNWNYSKHNESIYDYTTNPIDIEKNTYSQNIISTGFDYQIILNNFIFRTGLIYDYFHTGLAGPFIEAEGKSQGDYGLYLNLNYNLTDNYLLFGNLSRRTRFPTMRESYSGALGKFKLNPDLKPETGLLTELGILFVKDNCQIEFAAFANFYDDLIEKIRLSEDVDSLRRRIRVNYSQARIFGFDLSFNYQPVRNLSIITNFTLMKSSGQQGDINIEHLDNKPDILAGLILSYSLDFGLKIQAEMETVGVQYERNPNDNTRFVEINGTSIFNCRLSYRLPLIFDTLSELFFRVNNIADTYRIYQLGLPEPGRMFLAGISFNF